MEEAPENGKELSHSAHANGMNEYRFWNPVRTHGMRINDMTWYYMI